MAILQIYPQDVFYNAVDLQKFQPGQFCRIVAPVIKPIPQILDVERNHPEEHESVSFYLRNANKPKDFKVDDRGLPIKYLNLRAHEELLVQRAKKRLGIVLSSGGDIFPEIDKILKPKGKKHCQEEFLFIIPTYSIESPAHLGGFPPEMVVRIRCLVYRQFFYFPNCLPHFREGIARFDRIQTIIGKNPSSIEPIGISLSQEVWSLFLSMFLYCISGIEDESLKTARELTIEALPDLISTPPN